MTNKIMLNAMKLSEVSSDLYFFESLTFSLFWNQIRPVWNGIKTGSNTHYSLKMISRSDNDSTNQVNVDISIQFVDSKLYKTSAPPLLINTFPSLEFNRANKEILINETIFCFVWPSYIHTFMTSLTKVLTDEM